MTLFSTSRPSENILASFRSRISRAVALSWSCGAQLSAESQAISTVNSLETPAWNCLTGRMAQHTRSRSGSHAQTQ
ncbi:unnamed protein product [Lota lota]